MAFLQDRQQDRARRLCRTVAMLPALGFFFLVISCGPAREGGLNTLTPSERAKGWILLFNGHNLEGWRGLGGVDPRSGNWTVEAGAIFLRPSPALPGGKDRPKRFDLATTGEYFDFELAFEWKLRPGGNSGLKYNVSDEITRRFGPELSGRGGAVGFEYNLLDDIANPDSGVGPQRRAGSLYDLIPVSGGKPAQPDEFHSSRIVFRGGHGEHWLDGVRVLEYDLGSAEFARRVAASKFRSIPGFAARRAGAIVLQDHGDAAWFRALKIRRIAGKEKPAIPPFP